MGRPVAFEHFVDGLGGIAERARARGLRLTLEFFPESPVIPDLPAALAVLDAIHADNLGVMLDTVHYARSGGTVADLGQLTSAAIGGFQLADYPPIDPDAAYVPMAGRLLPDEGSLPLAPIVDALLAIRPDLRIDVEVFNTELQQLAPSDAARRAQAATRRLLERTARQPRSEH
jgi:sugar phosphate isomerase/epimerase